MLKYDVLCIVNGIFEIIAQCDETFLKANGIIKGAMNLIDTGRAELMAFTRLCCHGRSPPQRTGA
ncbi:hypothetical protein ABID25_006037 [Mesorhizobium abyssinicae]